MLQTWHSDGSIKCLVLSYFWSSLINYTRLWFIQVHIAQRGAIQPLIDLLESPDEHLKEMSAFALGRLAQVIITTFNNLYKEYKH